MVSDNTSPRRPVLTLDDLAPLSRRPERVHALSAAELAIAFSQGLDLAEGKQPGHAQRVAYIAMLLADALELEPAQRAGCFFGALLHDAGVSLAAADLWNNARVDEETIFAPAPLATHAEPDAAGATAPVESPVTAALHEHSLLGAELVRSLDLPEEAALAVQGHHERWGGAGYPHGTSGRDIPVEARVVAAADTAEVIIAGETNSLAARRRFGAEIEAHAGASIEPGIVGKLLQIARGDEFWLGMYAEDVAETLANMRTAADNRKSRKRLMRFAEAFADLADAKSGHTAGHSRRTAESAEKLAEALELDAGHVEMIRIAALLHDVGLLGVPARIMAKPDILSVSEMQLMRQHPAHSETVLESLPGFEEIAFWIARHHERPDGRGYPEMLSGDEIPLESRILSVADVYSALTAERAHRGAVSGKDARQILLGASGTQLDPELVRLFVTLI